MDACARWLAARIDEVERLVHTMPSIAVLVPHESTVQTMTDALNVAMSETSIKAVACFAGQALGQDLDVRVFDVQHVKGLEFEAVFFVGVDRLAADQPELFDKYLYVGTSRAAVYLGMTCEHRLPERLEPLRPLFGERWDASMLRP
jgi:DNA helicase IV